MVANSKIEFYYYNNIASYSYVATAHYVDLKIDVLYPVGKL